MSTLEDEDTSTENPSYLVEKYLEEEKGPQEKVVDVGSLLEIPLSSSFKTK